MDREKIRISVHDIPWVVGSLSFTGRTQEAQALLVRYENRLSAELLIIAQFFLAVTLTRHTKYSEGRELFAKNLRLGQKTRSPTARFFIEQGIGFYRFFSGQARIARVRAERAHTAATEGNFLYGRVLALDLQGHSMIECGEIQAGLEFLERATKLSMKLGDGSLSESMTNSQALYRLQFGLGGADSIHHAESRLVQISREDTYTESSLLLELARQYLWRGRGDQAKRALDRASQVIFSTQNRRHEIILNLRFGELLIHQGDTAQALNYLRSARALLHPGIDTRFELELLALELEACTELGWDKHLESLKKNAAQRLRLDSGTLAGREIARHCPEIKLTRTFKRNVDRFGDLLDSLVDPTPESIVACAESGYLGLLPKALKIPRGFQGIYLDPIPGAILLVHRGIVTLVPHVSPQIRRLILELAQRECSKEDLVRKIWKYKYHPLRHDPLVYQSMNQVRKILGEFSNWIVTNESGYSFQSGCQIIRPQADPLLEFTTTSSATRKTEISDQLSHHEDSLNYRQRKILTLAGKRETVDVRSLSRELSTLPLTISRDLSKLRQLNLLVRMGKGRSTQYVLKQ